MGDTLQVVAEHQCEGWKTYMFMVPDPFWAHFLDWYVDTKHQLNLLQHRATNRSSHNIYYLINSSWPTLKIAHFKRDLLLDKASQMEWSFRSHDIRLQSLYGHGEGKNYLLCSLISEIALQLQTPIVHDSYHQQEVMGLCSRRKGDAKSQSKRNGGHRGWLDHEALAHQRRAMLLYMHTGKGSSSSHQQAPTIIDRFSCLIKKNVFWSRF